MIFTAGSLFSGVGGIDLAAHWAGFETKWFVEKEPFCQKVLAKHWPNVPIYDDVFECKNLEHVTILHGGFPCQPFSVAGKRQGAKDERYLLPEMLRIVDEVKPYAVLFENVPGFPQINDGAEFKYLLRALAEVGFDGCEWGHIRASDIGAPHQRERWFCVAYTAGVRCQRHTARQEQNRLRQGWTPELAGGNSLMVNALSDGNGNTGNGRTLHHADRDSSQNERQRNIEQHGTLSSGASLGNANRAGRETPIQARKRAHSAKNRTGLDYRLGRSSHSGRQQGRPQSGVGREFDGISRRLDFPGFPARPGEDQYPYEPSRVTTIKQADRANRLKALGNAVVPYQVYPILAALHEWLTGLTVEDVA